MKISSDTISSPAPAQPQVKPPPDLVVAIMAHGAATETLKRHMPHFQAHLNGEFILWTPQNDPIHWPGLQVQHMGFKGHDGAEPLRRFKYMLRFLADGPWERLAILEYDCVLTRGWPCFDQDRIAGIFFREDNHQTFQGKQFGHPPLFLHREVARKLVQALDRIPLNAEGGMWDRALGYAMDLAEVKMIDLHEGGLGYSQNTIVPANHEELRAVTRNGACYFHGVKDPETLQVILQAKREE